MNIAKQVNQLVENLTQGMVFTFHDVLTDDQKIEATIKALNRMVQKGQLAKLSKGKYYKPETSIFGNLLPMQDEIVKDLLWKNNEPIGYLTGLQLYLKLGLTTQLSNIIEIGRNHFKSPLKRKNYRISFVIQKNAITKENIYLLQLLDVIKNIKKIPDSELNDVINRLLDLMSQLNNAKYKCLIELSEKYPPSTRALLGTILETLRPNLKLIALKSSLNPATKYRLSGITEILPLAKKWGFKL
ncbi:type IV toxin-antitoxin system AbiEi family antitoxin domain-containing protein [Conservatibacter flavescens]|uniref:AbiEi antitoxin C-terminal domain-containing protein n=1 Tax=Conservatibacter flavescens TaxID=28161 RepID=A0A2M8RZV7_9PAST|nr:DUF6088 family protein [Conservatibacter flavescens]PJG84430.1 hypothetical protein CVP05_11305 [Conservatibacter flavescens]